MSDSLKHQKFAELTSELTFGLTHRTIEYGGNTYGFFMHEMLFILIGYIGGASTINVRDVNGDCHAMTRTQVEEFLGQMYGDVIGVRHHEFCQKVKEWNACTTEADYNSFDPKTGWSWRSPALEAFESDS